MSASLTTLPCEILSIVMEYSLDMSDPCGYEEMAFNLASTCTILRGMVYHRVTDDASMAKTGLRNITVSNREHKEQKHRGTYNSIAIVPACHILGPCELCGQHLGEYDRLWDFSRKAERFIESM